MSEGESLDLPEVDGRLLICSIESLERRARFCIYMEKSKLLPNIGLLAVLTDTVRLGREYHDAMRDGFPVGSPDSQLPDGTLVDTEETLRI